MSNKCQVKSALVSLTNTSYQKQLEMAEEYWNSSPGSNPENLFYGEAKVVDIENIELWYVLYPHTYR